jgi:hypothetical protein
MAVIIPHRVHVPASFCGHGANLCRFILDDWAVVSLALICSFSRMRSHLGLEGEVKPETVPEETVLAVADVLRRSSSLRVSEDGKQVSRVVFCNYCLILMVDKFTLC